MKAIAALITWIAGSFTAWVGTLISAKIAAIIALVAVFTGIVGVVFAAIGGIVTGIEMTVNADLARAMSWFVPSNTIPCIGALISAMIVRATFDYHAAIVRLWSAAV